MKYHVTAAAASAILWCSLSIPGLAGAGEARAWTNASGTQTIEAEFLSLTDGKVHLRRKDTGKEIIVPLVNLSAADQEHVREMTGAPDAAPAEPIKRDVELPPPKDTKRADGSKPSGAKSDDKNRPADSEESPDPAKADRDDADSDNVDKNGKSTKATKREKAARSGRGKAKKPKSPDVQKGDFVINSTGVPMATFTAVMKYYGKPTMLKVAPKAEEVSASKGEMVSWQIYVPRAYTPDEPYGAMVYIDSGDLGRKAETWAPVFDKHKLILLSAAKSGNKTDEVLRLALALRGLELLDQTYALDPKRIYISGFGHGSRLASRLAIMYPETFSGAFYQSGCDNWAISWPMANLKLLKRASQNRYVMYTSSKDHNLPGTRHVFNTYRQYGFKFTTYLEAPDKSHSRPDASWFEKGIEALDAPLITKSAAKGAGKQSTKKQAED